MKRTVPLIGSLTSRDGTNTALFGSSQKDQYFKNCHFQVGQNAYNGRQSVAVMGRQEYAPATNPPSASGAGTAIATWRGSTDQRVSAFGNTNSTIYVAGTDVGTITGQAKFIDETSVNDTSSMLVTSTDNTGWYLPSDSFAQTAYTGDTHSNTTVDGIASTAGMYAGQAISGSGIPAGTRIASVDTTNSITLTAAATATAAGVALTKTAIAKILDADFPGNASMTVTGRFAPLDGYAPIMTTTGRIYTPTVNSLSNWVSTDYIVAQEYPDPGVGAIRYGTFVAAFSKGSVEFFRNQGNATGSPLSRVQSIAIKIGCPNQYAYCEWANSVAFIGNRSGVFGVYILNGTIDPPKISTAQIDDVLKSSGVSTARLNVITSYGDSFLLLTLTAAASNGYAYHESTKTWHPWSFTYSVTQSALNFDATAPGSVYVGSDSTKFIAGDTAVIAAEIQTGPLDESGERVRVKSVRLIGDRATSTLNLSVSVLYDDAQRTSETKTVDVSQRRQSANRMGSGVGPQVKITGLSGISNRVHRLMSLEVDLEPERR